MSVANLQKSRRTRSLANHCSCKGAGVCNACRAFYVCQIRPAIWKFLEGRAISASKGEGIWISYKVSDQENKI